LISLNTPDLLDRRPVETGSRRCEYIPTPRAEELREPLAAFRAWGERHHPV